MYCVLLVFFFLYVRNFQSIYLRGKTPENSSTVPINYNLYNMLKLRKAILTCELKKNVTFSLKQLKNFFLSMNNWKLTNEFPSLSKRDPKVGKETRFTWKSFRCKTIKIKTNQVESKVDKHTFLWIATLKSFSNYSKLENLKITCYNFDKLLTKDLITIKKYEFVIKRIISKILTWLKVNF